jgi:hypothetical protein
VSKLVQPLFEGSLNIVGDVHGEIDALRSLLKHLGYTHDGLDHPKGHRLVFVGDLCDRGPDSPAVVQLVRRLVGAGVAQAIVGNHELNVLRGEHKHGNAWFTNPEHKENQHEYACRTASTRERKEFADFFRTLPFALTRGDLRVVHACWDDEAIAILEKSTDDNITTFDRHEREANAKLAALKQPKQEALAPHEHGRFDQNYLMPRLQAVGDYDAKKQSLNPVRRVTSGPEHASETFWAKGEWRFCQRTRWWNDYAHPTAAVVFGHYWRRASVDPNVNDGNADVLGEYAVHDWHGRTKNAYCVDFSVGDRYRQRKRRSASAVGPFSGRLAAMSWPDRLVTFDDGEVVETVS